MSAASLKPQQHRKPTRMRRSSASGPILWPQPSPRHETTGLGSSASSGARHRPCSYHVARCHAWQDAGQSGAHPRLDFTGSYDSEMLATSMVGDGLRNLLKSLKDLLRPDWIIIDSRAGLADLGGLSLHGASHVDVMVARAGPQNYHGLDLALQSLCRRQTGDAFKPLVVHNLAPAEGLPEGRRIREEFRNHVYRSFERHRYSQVEEDAPSEDDTTAPHYPITMPSRDELLHVQSLTELNIFQLIASSEHVLFRERLRELTLRLTADEDEDDDEELDETGDEDG